MNRCTHLLARGLRLALPLLILIGCAGPPSVRSTVDATAPAPGVAEIGEASWYADSLHGRSTASGEPYDRDALTAAHRSLPFGTVVRVTRLDDGRSVRVRINDRGPFVQGRIIDLSRRAAEAIGMIEAGVVRVRVEHME